MKTKLIFIFLLISITSTYLHASTIGLSASMPGFSAKDILNQNLSSGDDIYWIDPDLPGGEIPFQIFADMTTFGGGWTMANDTGNISPTLNGHNLAINILAIDQDAELRFIGSGFDAYFTGKFNETLPTVGWTIISDDPSGLFGTDWNTSFSGNNVFVRETVTTAYPASVPAPASFLLLGTGLIGAKRRALKLSRLSS